MMIGSILKTSVTTLLVCAFLGSCDKVDKPLKSEYGFADNIEGNQVVLLEEFTGVRCQNCPDAAEVAKSIYDNYPDRVILVSIHAGFYSSPDGKHPVDLRNPTGDELLDILAPGLQTFPAGMFNRHGYPEDKHLFTSYSGWGTEAIKRLMDSTGVEITAKLSHSNNSFKVEIEAELLENIPDADLYVSALLLEDGIVAPQTHGQKVVEDYVHNHVLRASFNGPLGTALASGNLNSGDRFNKTFTLADEEEWVTENCHVVAFIYDATTYEVLQACKAEL